MSFIHYLPYCFIHTIHYNVNEFLVIWNFVRFCKQSKNFPSTCLSIIIFPAILRAWPMHNRSILPLVFIILLNVYNHSNDRNRNLEKVTSILRCRSTNGNSDCSVVVLVWEYLFLQGQNRVWISSYPPLHLKIGIM